MSDPIETKIDGQTYYQILGLEEKATEQEVKTSYRKLALKYHPDKATPENAKESSEMFIKVKTAYETLSDATKKTAYDKELEYERTPRPTKRASTFANASNNNNATYGSTSTAQPRYNAYSGGSSRRNYSMGADPDIIDEILNGTRTFARTYNFGLNMDDPPRNGATFERTADGVRWTWSFGASSGGSREPSGREDTTGGGGRRYSPPPPPVHPGRDQIAKELEAERKRQFARRRKEEEELERERERLRVRREELRRERDMIDREREERRIREAEKAQARAMDDYRRAFQTKPRTKDVANAAQERVRLQATERDTERKGEKKPSPKARAARVEEELDSTTRLRRSNVPVDDRDSRNKLKKEPESVEERRRARFSTPDLSRRTQAPELRRHDSSQSTAQRGDSFRKAEPVQPLSRSQAKRNDSIKAWAAELEPEEDLRRKRLSRTSSPGSSELGRRHTSGNYTTASSSRRARVETSSESSLERRRPSGARSPSRSKHHHSRHHRRSTESDSYDSDEFSSDDSGRFPRKAPRQPAREDERYKTRHEPRSAPGHSHSYNHSHRKDGDKKKGSGLGSFIGKVAKSILGDPESDSDTYSSYSSGSVGKRKLRRRERERGKVRY